MNNHKALDKMMHSIRIDKYFNNIIKKLKNVM